MTTTRKQIGDTNQKARAEAMMILTQMRGTNVNDLKTKDLAALVAVISVAIQWLGLVDEHGTIK